MLQRLRQNAALQGTLLILPTLAWIAALLIIPLALIVIASFGQRGTDGNLILAFSLDNYRRLLGDDLYFDIAWRSLLLAGQTTLLVIVIGYPLAYWIARAAQARRNLLIFLVLVPLWTNFVIRIYAWMMILRTQGVLNGLLAWLAGLAGFTAFKPLELLYTPEAVLIGMVYEFLPFMILPLYTSLEKIEPALYEAAADLGAGAWRTFWRVTLPLSLPGVVAGTILVFVPVMGTFIVSDILGGRKVILVGNLIQRQFLEARDPAFGSAASIILMALTLAVTLFYARRFGFGEELQV